MPAVCPGSPHSEVRRAPDTSANCDRAREGAVVANHVDDASAAVADDALSARHGVGEARGPKARAARTRCDDSPLVTIPAHDAQGARYVLDRHGPGVPRTVTDKRSHSKAATSTIARVGNRFAAQRRGKRRA